MESYYKKKKLITKNFLFKKSMVKIKNINLKNKNLNKKKKKKKKINS